MSQGSRIQSPHLAARSLRARMMTSHPNPCLRPEVYRVHRGCSGSLVGILFLRSYDHRKRIVVRESPSAHDPNIFEQIWLGFLFIPMKVQLQRNIVRSKPRSPAWPPVYPRYLSRSFLSKPPHETLTPDRPPCAMKFGVGVFRRIMSHGLGGSLVHKEFAHLNGLHKRIDFVATSPVCQGQGIATEVLNAVCADADDEGTLLYLSATDRSKQLYYERFGFRVVGEGRSHPSAAHATAGMARMPKGRADAGEEVREVGDVVASSAQGNGRMPSALVRVALPLAGFTFAVWVGWSRKGSKGFR